MTECGTDISKYFEYIKTIANGSFGMVYLAKVLPAAKMELPEFKNWSDHPVAIKNIRCKNLHECNQCIKEIQIMKKINGKYNMRYYGCFVVRGSYHIVMELCDGQNLKDILKSTIMSVETLITILRDLAYAIRELHSHGVVHRDIKPANIMICDGKIKLVDYGLSLILGDMNHKYRSFVGTPSYMDLWDLPREQSYLADWWAWGQIAAYMFTGKDYLVPAGVDKKQRIIELRGVPHHFKPVNPSALDDLPHDLRNLILNITDPNKEPIDRPNEHDIITILESLVPDEV